MATWETIVCSEFREVVLYGRVILIECSTLYNKLSKDKYPIQLARTLPTSAEQFQLHLGGVWPTCHCRDLGNIIQLVCERDVNPWPLPTGASHM